MKCFYIMIFTISFSYPQLDVIFFKDGRSEKGDVSINGQNVTLKPKFGDKVKFYNTDFINTIKSWNGDIIFPEGVIVNTISSQYHLSNVEHILSTDNQKYYDSGKNAEKDGLIACKACFKTAPKIPDYYLEKDLVKELIKNIRINHEILYEYPSLSKMQKMMQEILNKWPEDLKGYDYRIQIIKDDAVNAFAVPGGNLYFNTGLLDIIEDEAELESVMVHEIAHVERRHGLREFKKTQKNRMVKDVAVLLTAAAAIATENQNMMIAANAVNLIGEFAIEILSKGYSRENEQESDIMAQIYFDNHNKDKKMMISLLDKLATNTIVQQGYIPPTNAYGSHPNIIKRIEQIRSSERLKYDENLIFEVNPMVMQNVAAKRGRSKPIDISENLTKYDIQPNFMNFEISDVFVQTSSNIDDEYVFVLLGKINNRHSYIDFNIKEIQLNFLGSIGVTPIKGIVDLIVPSGATVDFTGELHCRPELKDALFLNFKEKKILPFSIKTSAVILESGRNPKPVKGLNSFNSSMTIY